MAIDLHGDYATSTPKPLPVFLLLDVSGSMYGTKIEELNEAVATMISTFSKVNDFDNIEITIITFGDNVNVIMEKTPASEAKQKWTPLTAHGPTPMGTALQQAKCLIEDRDFIKGRSYRPVVALVSDGEPTDYWQEPMQSFINEGRSKKCTRLAMAIGDDANTKILSKFLEGTDQQLFKATDASKIKDFFELVTMTTTATLTQGNSGSNNQLAIQFSTSPVNTIVANTTTTQTSVATAANTVTPAFVTAVTTLTPAVSTAESDLTSPVATTATILASASSTAQPDHTSNNQQIYGEINYFDDE